MRRIVLILAAVAVTGCGDPATEDARGYTKAPLESPGLLVGGEPRSELAVEIALEPGLTAVPPQTETPGTGAVEGQGGDTVEPSLPSGVTQEEFDQGQQLFAGPGGCQACHGPDGTGSQLAPDLTDDEWLNVPGPDIDVLAELIRTGVAEPQQHPAPMPPMGGANLSDDQVRALAAYVASLGG